ncbi:unnamed protein product [Haemonchus placei]|uniref:Leucine-rich repeat extensin-like protein 3 n=1 Tax=Haemonchus placei TaxID=6290 RepID=A0A0N4X9D9_HAEPC|nr:unnamed protein product [Haemonchus placei]
MFSFITAICLLGVVTAWPGQIIPPPPPPPPPPLGPHPVIFPPNAPVPPHPTPSPPQPAPWPFVEVVPTPPEILYPYPPSSGFSSYPWGPKPEVPEVRRYEDW